MSLRTLVNKMCSLYSGWINNIGKIVVFVFIFYFFLRGGGWGGGLGEALLWIFG